MRRKKNMTVCDHFRSAACLNLFLLLRLFVNQCDGRIAKY